DLPAAPPARPAHTDVDPRTDLSAADLPAAPPLATSRSTTDLPTTDLLAADLSGAGLPAGGGGGGGGPPPPAGGRAPLRPPPPARGGARGGGGAGHLFPRVGGAPAAGALVPAPGLVQPARLQRQHPLRGQLPRRRPAGAGHPVRLMPAARPLHRHELCRR